MPVPGLAEALPGVLRLLRQGRLKGFAVYRYDPEAARRLDGYLEKGAEVPTLSDLAALLDRFHFGFAGLERIQLFLETGRGYIIGSPRIPATLVVERLDLGLRALRQDRRLTRAELAEAAGVKAHDLSAVEDVRRRAEPSLAQLDAILRALASSYQELETVTAEPLRVGEKLQRKLRHAERWLEPVVLDGRALPTIVSARLDLALLSMRLQAGKSRKALAREAGIELQRLTNLESPDVRSRPSEEELRAILRALGCGAVLLERAARAPLRGISKLTSARRPWRHGRRSRRPYAESLAKDTAKLPSSARGLEAALSEVRKHWPPPLGRTLEIKRSDSVAREVDPANERLV